MSLIAEFDEIVLNTFKLLGKPIDTRKYIIVDRPTPHNPEKLPPGMMGICTFWHDGNALVVGRAGSKSNSRFYSQHYNPKSSQSNLAASLLSDISMSHLRISEASVCGWIKKNCRRIDILLDANFGTIVLERIKASLVEKYNPKYERRTAQH